MTRVVRGLVVSAAVLVFLLNALSRPAGASLIGDSVSCANCLPDSATVIDPGAEFFVSFGITADIGPASITIANPSSFIVSFPAGTGVTFGDLDSSAGDVVGASLTTQQGANLTESDVSFGADSVTLDLGGTQWSPASTAIISLVFENATVPAPATLLLLVAAIRSAGLVGAWRRW